MLRPLLVSVTFAFAMGLPVCGLAAEQPPNLILIMADDLGYECITANGGESYQTPHIDKLAETGMRFERCYVQPLCTPTRVQLMTGLYNVRNYIEFGLLDPQAKTFAHHLKAAGYVTGIAGKWQLGRDPGLPQHFGFDEAYLWQHTRRPPRYANPGMEHNDQELNFDSGEYGPTLINEFALDFITRHQSEPFLLYYPMVLTHDPFQPTPDSPNWDPAAVGEQVNRRDEHFADMVSYMDKLIGRVIARLDELELRENTLVIFLGDNGTHQRITSQFRGKPYPGGKRLPTARGMHVPLIANWPGKIPAGSVNDNLISSTDFFPTLCAAAGIEDSVAMPADGISFLPQLFGQQGDVRRAIYCWYARGGGATAEAEFAMDAAYKLYSDGRFYALKEDPYEEAPPRQKSQLTGTEAQAAQQLQTVLNSYTEARPPHLKTPSSAK